MPEEAAFRKLPWLFPDIADHLTLEAAEDLYGPGITFQISFVTMSTNTGTYIDVPFHRYADGRDLADLALDRAGARPPVVFDHVGTTAIDLTRRDGHHDRRIAVRWLWGG